MHVTRTLAVGLLGGTTLASPAHLKTRSLNADLNIQALEALRAAGPGSSTGCTLENAHVRKDWWVCPQPIVDP